MFKLTIADKFHGYHANGYLDVRQPTSDEISKTAQAMEKLPLETQKQMLLGCGESTFFLSAHGPASTMEDLSTTDFIDTSRTTAPSFNAASDHPGRPSLLRTTRHLNVNSAECFVVRRL